MDTQPIADGAGGWAGGPLLGFDLETTGVSPESDRVVTAAIVLRVPGRSTDVWNWLVNPGIEIPAGATAIHGISTEHARASGQAPIEALDEVASKIASSLRAGIPLVGMNISYDVTLLNHDLARNGLATLAERIGGPVAPVLDPLVIDRWKDRYRRGKRTLSHLAAHYGVQPEADLHAADVDVLATLDVLEAQIKRYPELASMSLPDLHAAQAAAHREWAEHINQWWASQGSSSWANPVWLT